MANCPYCSKYFSKKQAALDHINKYHGNYLERDNMDAAQALYYSTHGTLKGKCMCGCGQDTEWNYKTGKPFKVSDDPECRKRLRNQALRNHKRVYGTETLLNDMEHQKEMQKHRPTAGEYTFSDGGKVGYLSSLELNFLQFCDKVMEFESKMVQDSPETFTYKDPKDGKLHQYIPDFYLPDYNLLIEIKDGGENPNTNPAFIKETKYKVALKDEVMKKQNRYNYIKIVDKKYGPFMELLYQIVRSDTDYKAPGRTLAVITESALLDPDDSVNFNSGIIDNIQECYLMIALSPNTDSVVGVGISEYSSLDNLRYTDYDTSTLYYVDPVDIRNRYDVETYRYLGVDMDNMTHAIKVIDELADESHDSSVWDILDILAQHNIYFTSLHANISNNSTNLMDFVWNDNSIVYEDGFVRKRKFIRGIHR